MANNADLVIICPGCGTENQLFESHCQCGTPLDPSMAVDRASLPGGVPGGIAQLVVTLHQLTLTEPHQRTGLKLSPNGDGSYVIGRSFETTVPDLDIKPWAVPFTSPQATGRQYGISRQHAVLVIQNGVVTLSPHPNATLDTTINGSQISQETEINSGDVVALGLIFEPGTRARAPGVIFEIELAMI